METFQHQHICGNMEEIGENTKAPQEPLSQNSQKHRNKICSQATETVSMNEELN